MVQVPKQFISFQQLGVALGAQYLHMWVIGPSGWQNGTITGRLDTRKDDTPHGATLNLPASFNPSATARFPSSVDVGSSNKQPRQF